METVLWQCVLPPAEDSFLQNGRDSTFSLMDILMP